MAQGNRQRNLFAAEDFRLVYDSFRQANFMAYDYDTIRSVLVDYIQRNYPENYNSWIQSSEFVALIETLAFLSHSLAFRIDLAARENFLSTAERRESILRIVDFLGYVPKRSIPASGFLKITSIRTTQDVYNINGESLKGVDVDFENEYQNFLLVLNEVLSQNNKFGRPIDSTVIGNTRNEIYKTNSVERDIVYEFSARVNNINQPFEVHSVEINKNANTIIETVPDPSSSFDLLHRNDNQGLGSTNTGFFVGFKQGDLTYSDISLDQAIPNLVVNVDGENVNNTDVHFQEIDNDGNIIALWEQVDPSFGSNIIYNLLQSNRRKLFTVKTLDNDRINLVFGDGIFSEIPRGTFRIWYRTGLNQTYTLNIDDVAPVTFSFRYRASDGNNYQVTFVAELQVPVTNASARESVTSIKDNAGRVFAAQDRLVSGPDYAVFPLTVNENVRKIKSINRTYVGHSRFVKNQDPTAQYQTVDMIGRDGYLYTEPHLFNYTIPLPTNLTDNQIFEKVIADTIKNPELINLFYDKHNPYQVAFTETTDSFEWQQISKTFGGSTGYFTKEGIVQRVGSNSTSATSNIAANSIVEFIETPYNIGSIERYEILDGGLDYTSPPIVRIVGTGTGARATSTISNGQVTGIIPEAQGTGYENPVTVEIVGGGGVGARVKAVASSAKRIWARVIDIYQEGLGIEDTNGTPTGLNTRRQGAVILNRVIPNSARISQIFPAYNTSFTLDEKTAIIAQLANKNSFGIRFDLNSKSWKVINASNLADDDSNNPDNYSLDNAGSSTQIDNSWLIRVNYESGPEQWQFISRRTRYIFGSENQVRFYNQNNQKKFNIDTNKPERDTITISKINTAGDSRFELGVDTDFYVHKYFVNPDGTTDDRLISVSVGDLDADNYPDDPLSFKNIVSTNLINIDYNKQSNNYRAPTDSGTSRSGRLDLTFVWRRISESRNRISPSISNINDIFVLTQHYDNTFRQWLIDRIGPKPAPVSELELETHFTQLATKKITSDSIVYRPAEYKILFGELADPELQGIFRVIPVTGQTLTDNEIKDRIQRVIHDFFNIDNWDFGETFHFTELAAFVHQQMPGIISSIVLTPLQLDQDFGELFQITPNSNELFIPDISLKEIEIISS